MATVLQSREYETSAAGFDCIIRSANRDDCMLRILIVYGSFTLDNGQFTSDFSRTAYKCSGTLEHSYVRWLWPDGRTDGLVLSRVMARFCLLDDSVAVPVL